MGSLIKINEIFKSIDSKHIWLKFKLSIICTSIKFLSFLPNECTTKKWFHNFNKSVFCCNVNIRREKKSPIIHGYWCHRALVHSIFWWFEWINWNHQKYYFNFQMCMLIGKYYRLYDCISTNTSNQNPTRTV